MSFQVFPRCALNIFGFSPVLLASRCDIHFSYLLFLGGMQRFWYTRRLAVISKSHHCFFRPRMKILESRLRFDIYNGWGSSQPMDTGLRSVLNLMSRISTPMDGDTVDVAWDERLDRATAEGVALCCLQMLLARNIRYRVGSLGCACWFVWRAFLFYSHAAFSTECEVSDVAAGSCGVPSFVICEGFWCNFPAGTIFSLAAELFLE